MMTLEALAVAVAAGASQAVACRQLGLDERTVQRWRASDTGTDGRQGPRSNAHNALTLSERKEVVRLVTDKQYRDLSPKQIVPQLADNGRYIASESTVYRILRKEKLATHRGRQKPRQQRKLSEYVATGPRQVWSWDITYLKSPIRGAFFYLYLIVDVWSRKIVGAEVHEVESSEDASGLVHRALLNEQADPTLLVLHSDNGGPMKGATLKATLDALGIMASYSRPRVSNDNPFSEALFRTLKYRPEYPLKPFESLEHARGWVAEFVDWYNDEHLHSALSFVTPVARHTGAHTAQLARRRMVYEAARQRHPERWSKNTRRWMSPATVILNPSKQTKISQQRGHAA